MFSKLEDDFNLTSSSNLNIWCIRAGLLMLFYGDWFIENIVYNWYSSFVMDRIKVAYIALNQVGLILKMHLEFDILMLRVNQVGMF